MIARKLAPDNRIVCASPDYLAKCGEPTVPQELPEHQCINLIGLETWMFDTPDGRVSIKTHARVRTDNGEAVRDACADGLGISMSSTWNIYKHLQRGELIQILRDYPLVSETALWAVYPSSRLLAPKVRVFIDHFAEYFGSPPYWDQELQY